MVCGVVAERIGRSVRVTVVDTAEELANAIVWLLSASASFVTGAHLNVSGGGFLIGAP